MGGEQERLLEAMSRQRSEHIDEDRLERFRLDMKRARKVEMLARAAQGDGRERDRIIESVGQTFEKRVGDPSIGPEWEMRALLFDGSKSDQRGAFARANLLLDLRPDRSFVARRRT